MSDWTQPVCDFDYEWLEPGRTPHRLVEQYRTLERCCICGNRTVSGIYVRIDPDTVKYPTRGQE